MIRPHGNAGPEGLMTKNISTLVSGGRFSRGQGVNIEMKCS